MAEYITDRTEEDVFIKNEKGQYTWVDLNRVETAVEELQEKAKQIAVYLNLSTKTDWVQVDLFHPDTYYAYSQMERYIGNIKSILDAVGVGRSGVPQTMDRLDWKKANAIEKALKSAEDKMNAIIQTLRYSGEFYAGEVISL